MRRFTPFAGLLAALAASGPLAADPAPAPTLAAPAPMTADQLAEVSGGQSLVANALTTQTLSASVSGNQINAGTIQSGAVSFDKGAFSGFNGVGNFVINTGNNNILQGSLSVTVVPLR